MTMSETGPFAGDDPGHLLEAAFAAARTDAARPAPEALLQRIAADADRVGRAHRRVARPSAGRRGLLAQVVRAIGGWPALGGLASAGAAGLWLGFAPPAAVEARGGWLGQTAAGDDLALMLSADYLDLAEEG